MHRNILAIDQGTTGSTALIINQDLQILGSHTVDFAQHFPQPSWVEHDLNEIWSSVTTAVEKVLEKTHTSANDIAAIGLTNQRETTCVWHRNSEATPVHRAIVWQDRRTAEECKKLKARGLEKDIRKKTGLLLDPYFSGTKLAWILKNNPEAMKLAKQNKIAFGTIESFLLYKITGEHRTEPSNACRTLLMNLKNCQWDDSLIKLFGIPKNILPEILPSMTVYGKTKNFLNLPDGIPVSGMAGDQQSALFGQACFTKASVKCTYGTGAFILANTGNSPIFSKHGLLTSVGWKWNGKTTYVLEGSAFIAGAAVQWVRDGLNMIPLSSEIENLASSVKDSDGVVFVPALSGLGSPHWLPYASGLITGLTRRTTKGHIARATLEGIAFQVYELLEAMKKDIGKKLSPIKVDGGASINKILMQFQADLLGVEVIQSKILETTALGAALQAGLGIGFWKDEKEIQKKWSANLTFKPNMAAKLKSEKIHQWKKAIQAVELLSQK